MLRRLSLSCLLAIALAVVPVVAGAAVFNVASGDVAGLIAAVNAANTTAEPDTINLAAGTYTLTTPQAMQTGLPEIATDIQIVGAGAGATVLTRISGNPIFRFISVASTGRLRLEGLTISGGQINGLGGAIRSAGDLAVVNCVLTDNHVFTNVGGAIFQASGTGGGLLIEGTTLSSNSAESGGAIYVAGPFTMRNSQVLSNSASVRAAVSWASVGDGDVARIEDSLIQGNDNSGLSAGITPGRGAILQIVRSTIDGNQRGGLSLGGESLWAFVTDSTISNNTSNSVGAGIFAAAKLVVRRSTISGNTSLLSSVNGGGGLAVGADVTIENSTISGNSARGSGGGIYMSASLPRGQGVHIRSSTITDNTADAEADGTGRGGGIASGGARFELIDTIVAGNVDRSGTANDCAGPIVSNGHNLIGDTAGCGIALVAGDVTGDAKLGPLGPNGGPTHTHVPQPGSPAIDAADPGRCGAPDQRFFARPVDGDGDSAARCDIGAVEAGSAIPVVFLPDHFLCYGASTSPGTPPLPSLHSVSLVDDIETKDFDVRKSKALCTPADVSAAGIDDTDVHLHARLIVQSAGQPPHARQRGLTFVNELGAFTVDTVRPDRLLVPATKGLDAFPPPPDPNAHDVDRYKCYLAQASPGAPKLPLGAAALRVAIANQFTTGRVFHLNEVTRICTSVDEEGLGRKHPAAHLVCYQAVSEKPLVSGDIEKAIDHLRVSSEWGNEQLDAQRSTYEVCLASLLGS